MPFASANEEENDFPNLYRDILKILRDHIDEPGVFSVTRHLNEVINKTTQPSMLRLMDYRRYGVICLFIILSHFDYSELRLFLFRNFTLLRIQLFNYLILIKFINPPCNLLV